VISSADAGRREQLLSLRALRRTVVRVVGGQEQERESEPLGVDVGAHLLGPGAHQGARDLGEQPGTVAGQPVGGDRAAVAHTAESLDRPIDDLAVGLSVDARNESDAAGVALG
jgi:hypothetical protein